jgi:hypothetical protein
MKNFLIITKLILSLLIIKDINNHELWADSLQGYNPFYKNFQTTNDHKKIEKIKTEIELMRKTCEKFARFEHQVNILNGPVGKTFQTEKNHKNIQIIEIADHENENEDTSYLDSQHKNKKEDIKPQYQNNQFKKQTNIWARQEYIDSEKAKKDAELRLLNPHCNEKEIQHLSDYVPAELGGGSEIDRFGAVNFDQGSNSTKLKLAFKVLGLTQGASEEEIEERKEELLENYGDKKKDHEKEKYELIATVINESVNTIKHLHTQKSALDRAISEIKLAPGIK